MPSRDHGHPHRLKSMPLRLACAGVGLTFMVLGLAGIFLPLLPTTPFVLLAAACFVRSSRRLDRWLHEHERFGPSLRAWRDHRSMPPGAKRLALWMLAFSLGLSIALLDDGRLQLALACLGLILGVALWRIPTRHVDVDEPKQVI